MTAAGRAAVRLDIIRRPLPPDDDERRAPPLDGGLDWARIADWTQRIIDGDLVPIARVFADHGAAAPEITWDPAPDQPSAPPLRFLLEHWGAVTRGIELPLARKINPFELAPALGYVMKLEPVEGGRDFRYRLYGSRLIRISGFDMTGKVLSEHPASGCAIEFAIAVYRAAMRRRHPLYTTRHPLGAKFTRRWHRLVLPYADASGSVTRLLCGTVAIGADGRVM